MFPVDSKKQIEDFKKQISEQEQEIRSQNKKIETLKFQIENPPKFKTGDKVGDLIITKINYSDGNFLSLFTNPYFTSDLIISLIFGGKLTDDSKKYASKQAIQGYNYDLTNTKTGETLSKKESELFS